MNVFQRAMAEILLPKLGDGVGGGAGNKISRISHNIQFHLARINFQIYVLGTTLMSLNLQNQYLSLRTFKTILRTAHIRHPGQCSFKRPAGNPPLPTTPPSNFRHWGYSGKFSTFIFVALYAVLGRKIMHTIALFSAILNL